MRNHGTGVDTAGVERPVSSHSANPAPVEEAFQTAIAVAKRQDTRSFELRAALVLAKLYQSTARPAPPTPAPSSGPLAH